VIQRNCNGYSQLNYIQWSRYSWKTQKAQKVDKFVLWDQQFVWIVGCQNFQISARHIACYIIKREKDLEVWIVKHKYAGKIFFDSIYCLFCLQKNNNSNLHTEVSRFKDFHYFSKNKLILGFIILKLLLFYQFNWMSKLRLKQLKNYSQTLH